MGVVAGVVMSCQFGTNRSVFSDVAGSVPGPLLAYEVLTAFFLEATFLGIMLFALASCCLAGSASGRRRISSPPFALPSARRHRLSGFYRPIHGCRRWRGLPRKMGVRMSQRQENLSDVSGRLSLRAALPGASHQDCSDYSGTMSQVRHETAGFVYMKPAAHRLDQKPKSSRGVLSTIFDQLSLALAALPAGSFRKPSRAAL